MTGVSSAPEVLRAKSFVLVDDAGRDRAQLNAGEYWAVFQLLDSKGRPRITVQVDDEGNPSICLWTDHNAPAISLPINRDRGNGITVGDAKATPCVQIGVPEPGSETGRFFGTPYVSVDDYDGRQIFSTIEQSSDD